MAKSRAKKDVAKKTEQKPRIEKNTIYAIIAIAVILVSVLCIMILLSNHEDQNGMLPWTSSGETNAVEVLSCKTATGEGSKSSFQKIADGFVVTDNASVYRVVASVQNKDDMTHKVRINMSMRDSSGTVMYSTGESGTFNVLTPNKTASFSWYYTREELTDYVGDISKVASINLEVILIP